MSFATTVIAQFDVQILDLSVRIAEFEQLLDGLRQEKARLEAERQARQTAAAAGDSALEQMSRFLNMAERIGDRNLIAEFWLAVDELRSSGGAIADLPPAPIDPDPETPVTNDVPVIDAEVEQVHEQPVMVPQEADDVVVERQPIPDGWEELKAKELRELCKQRGLATNGKRSELIERLKESVGILSDGPIEW